MQRNDKRAEYDTPGRKPLHALPFTGREGALGILRDLMRAGAGGSGALVFITGESGVGKTRLVEHLAAEARASGWTHAAGRAYEVETGCPYAMIAHALTPVLERMDAQALTIAARGMESELTRILPVLSRGRSATVEEADGDAKTRMLWHFTQFLHRLGERHPLLLTLENLHWADAASLELLYFVGRQLTGARLVILATYPEEEGASATALQRVVRASLNESGAKQLHLPTMSTPEVAALVQQTFAATGAAVDDFALRLSSQTRGNAFFTEEILKSLVERGDLREVGDRWVGWDADVSRLPATVRESVRLRLASLSITARRMAGIMSTVGTRVHLHLLEQISGDSAMVLAEPLEELVRRGMIIAPAPGDAPIYDFAHPIVRGVVYDNLGAARARAYHERVVRGLEAMHGDDAELHAAELAPHLTHAGDRVAADRSVKYFLAAGRDALERHAALEADRFLTAALESIDRPGSVHSSDSLRTLLPLLAQAKQRQGAHGAATLLWLRARDLARAAADVATEAAIERNLGLVALGAGELGVALVHFEAAEERAYASAQVALALRARVARGMALQSLGRSDEGRRLIQEIIPTAESLGDAALLARVHRAMVLQYSWTGPASEARRHGAIALHNAQASGDRDVAWSVHWALALMAGLAGDGARVRDHQQAAERLATELQSQLRLARIAEIGIEYAAAEGRWDEALDLAERVLPIARELAPRTLLPRLLVWTGTVRIERDEIERAHALFTEAWELSGADGSTTDAMNVNAIIPCIGMATYHLQRHDFAQVVSYADRGLAIVDRLGAIAWSIHRLLPILCEALIWLQEYKRAEQLTRRLREQSRALDHPLGLVVADAVDALLRRFRDNDVGAHADLLSAAERMEAIPFIFPAARLRLNAAQLLAADGLRDDAVRQLRMVHEVFQRMGAVRELRIVRDRMRELGVRPPIKTCAPGGTLTGREQEIAELVARRKSNKEIAKELDVSSRTVGAHLHNIFVKFGVDTRGALADAVRGVEVEEARRP